MSVLFKNKNKTKKTLAYITDVNLKKVKRDIFILQNIQMTWNKKMQWNPYIIDKIELQADNTTMWSLCISSLYHLQTHENKS